MIIISICLGRLGLCIKSMFLFCILSGSEILQQQKFKVDQGGAWLQGAHHRTPKPSTTYHCWVWTNIPCAWRLMNAERLHISSGYRKETIAKCKTAVTGSLKFTVVIGGKTSLPISHAHSNPDIFEPHMFYSIYTKRPKPVNPLTESESFWNCSPEWFNAPSTRNRVTKYAVSKCLDSCGRENR